MEILTDLQFSEIVTTIQDCFFVEVGANDGINLDPLHRLIVENKWHGILVEPDKKTFERLKENYKNNFNLVFENCAISDKDGEVDLFCGTTDLHYSLSYKHAEWMFDVTPQAIAVPSLRLSSLLDKHSIEKVDLLMIDVEGYDFIVLKTFPYTKIKPKVVRLEIVHISSENSSTEEVVVYLQDLGYDCYLDQHSTDIIGVLK